MPCGDFTTIDTLWTYYSQGKFGFTPQIDIYYRSGGKTTNDENSLFLVSTKVQHKAGWYNNHQLKAWDDLDFSLNAPKGHLPTYSIPRHQRNGTLFLGLITEGEAIHYLAQAQKRCENLC
ncbi:MAG: GUN4 domain-containing protein [Microcystaceae cyanobacterium]